MEKEVALVRRLRSDLLRWVPVIERSTGSKVTVQCEGAQIVLVATWNNKNYKKTLTRDVLFGRTTVMAPEARALQQRPCQYARAFIRELLEQRGVI